MPATITCNPTPATKDRTGLTLALLATLMLGEGVMLWQLDGLPKAVAGQMPRDYTAAIKTAASVIDRPEIADRRWIALYQAGPALASADLAIVGDSIVAFGDWSSLLGRPVAKVGVCGARSSDLAECVTAAARPGRTLILSVGVNDIFDHQGTPEEIAARVLTLARQGRDAGARVLVCLPLLTRVDAHNARIVPLNAALARACRAAGFTCIDANPGLAPASGGGLLLAEYTTDGIHLTPAGYAVLAASIAPGINPGSNPGISALPPN